MSDAAENQDLEEGHEELDDTKQTTAEDVARKGGWRPESEWEDDDPKKPREFSSAEVFNARGEFIGRLKDQDKRIANMETQFNTRLDNSNKLHKAQLELQKEDLISKRDAAIDLADRTEANKIQGQIDNLDVPVEQAPVNNDQAVCDTWNKNNPWAFQDGPKSIYAQHKLTQYREAGQDINSAIANMEADIARDFPDINNNRNTEAIPEGGSKGGGGRRQAKAVTMSDLTSEEARIWKISGNSWGSEKEFLQSVQDIRSES